MLKSPNFNILKNDTFMTDVCSNVLVVYFHHQKKTKMNNNKPSTFINVAALVGWIGICYLVAWTGATVSPGIVSPEWYESIQKPEWNPPAWIFGPVWTFLYTAMGIAAWNVWRKYRFGQARVALSLFLIQLVLNGLWSQLFFGFHQIGWAFLEIIILLFFIVLTTIAFFYKSKLSGWLMVPYIAWVSFATVLNGTIWWIN